MTGTQMSAGIKIELAGPCRATVLKNVPKPCICISSVHKEFQYIVMLRAGPYNHIGFAMKKYAQISFCKDSCTVTTRSCQNKAKPLESTVH